MGFIFWLLLLFHVFVIIGFLISARHSPTTTLAWLITITLLPGVGLFLYLLMGRNRIKRIKRRISAVAKRLQKALAKHSLEAKMEELKRSSDWDFRTETMVRLAESMKRFPASVGNQCEILPGARETYEAIHKGMLRANHHIHVEFYIIRPDETGRNLRDLLVRKALEGIQVKVLFDAVGSSSLPSDFWYPLERAGGKAAVFNPILMAFRFRDRIDFRNHRKIVVIDGKVGFTGGINVGKEYLGLCPEVGHWRDTHIKIVGPAVLHLQKTFAEDWLSVTNELIDEPQYYPAPSSQAKGKAVVDIIESGPDDQWASIHRVYLQSIAMAEERVWITSPYFVPDPVLEEILITTALRGVDVRVLVPLQTDTPLAEFASRSFYESLTRAGVRIFQYAKGFVHAKTMIVDKWVGTIGSANMDIRSFKLNFELNAFVYDKKFTEELAEQFLTDLEVAREISLEEIENWGFGQRLAVAVCRLFSPLL